LNGDACTETFTMKRFSCFGFLLFASLYSSGQGGNIITINRNLKDSLFHINDCITLPYLDFEEFRCGVKPESMDSLHRIASFLNEHPSLLVEINTYNDDPEPRAGYTFTQCRASACRDSLIRLGVMGSRMICLGHGLNDSYLVGKDMILPSGKRVVKGTYLSETFFNAFKSNDENDLQVLHRLNRRTELVVVGLTQIGKQHAALEYKDHFYFHYSSEGLGSNREEYYRGGIRIEDTTLFVSYVDLRSKNAAEVTTRKMPFPAACRDSIFDLLKGMEGKYIFSSNTEISSGSIVHMYIEHSNWCTEFCLKNTFDSTAMKIVLIINRHLPRGDDIYIPYKLWQWSKGGELIRPCSGNPLHSYKEVLGDEYDLIRKRK
jgi:hypothetical protein